MDKCWKQFERGVARALGGKRYPANQGGVIDVETPWEVVQCKERRALSLGDLTTLTGIIEEAGRTKGKRGLVVVKVRRGRGKATTTLVVQSLHQYLTYRETHEGGPEQTCSSITEFPTDTPSAQP
jgi:hypothetical protein